MKVNKKDLEMFTDEEIKMLAKCLLNGRRFSMLYDCNLVDFNRVIDEMTSLIYAESKPNCEHLHNLKTVLRRLGKTRFSEYDFHVYFGDDYDMYDEYLDIYDIVASNGMKLFKFEFFDICQKYSEKKGFNVSIDFLEEIYDLYTGYLSTRFEYLIS